ncbi:MAG: flavodoxin, partial [Lancefieldella rimae]
KKVFFIYTCGRLSAAHTNDIRKIAEEMHAEILGEYGCVGFDTFGPLKLIGGMRKGHPNAEEVRDAVKFYQGIVNAQEEPEKD